MRSKLKLHLEDLTIDTFNTTSPSRSRGTVFGEQCTCWTQCGQNTCPGCPTCEGYNTCGESCNGTCGAASCDCTYGEYTCGGSCNLYCTQGWEVTCRNVGTCYMGDTDCTTPP